MARNTPVSEMYTKQRNEIGKLMAKIEKGLANHESDGKATGLTFGHVADLDYYASQLRQISDRLNREGEYAPENIA